MNELDAYLAEGYLLHGSVTDGIELFEPRQAYSCGKPDGEPAVHASSMIEPAVFMAVIGHRGGGGWSSYGPKFFYIDSDYWWRAQAEDWSGWVYALPKEGFEHRTGFEWRSFSPVRAVHKVAVGLADLPMDDIEITVPERLLLG